MTAYKDKDRNTWYCTFRYTDWTGKIRQGKKRGFLKKKDAQEYEGEFIKKESGNSDMSFASLTKLYLADYKKRARASSYVIKKNLIDTKLTPYFNEQKISDITPVSIREWQNKMMEEDYAQSYLRSVNIAMRSVFRYAEKYYRIENPAKNSDPIGKEKPSIEMDFWTLDEFRAFINVIAKKHYPGEIAFKILFYTGIRCGELLALTYDDIDFEHKKIYINKTYMRIEKKDVIQPPKTSKSQRHVTVFDSLLDDMKEYKSHLVDYETSDRLFPFTKDYLYYIMKKYTAIAKVKCIRLHDLRHSHASLLIHMGYDALVVSQRLGHENIQTTLQTYSHLYPDKQKDLAESLEKIANFNICCQNVATDEKKDRKAL